MTTTRTPAICISDLRFAWAGQAPVLDIPSLQVGAGERVFLHGASGSGKSTLLALLGGVLQPQSGSLVVLGHALQQMSAARRDRLRAAQIGFVFQMFNLLPYLSVLDNVLLPLRFSSQRRERLCAAGQREALRAGELLQSLGLSDQRLWQRTPTQLSQGQQQRVAVARALIGQPALVVADEPTSALDSDARSDFLALLLRECAAAGSTLVFVSHDHSLAPLFDRRLAMADINRVGQS